MPTDGSELVSRFTMERVCLSDAPSHGYFHYNTSILNRTYYCLTLVIFLSSLTSASVGKRQQPSYTAWEEGFGPITASFLNRLSTNLPGISPIFILTSIVTQILEFFNVTSVTSQFFPFISHTFSGLLSRLSLIHLVPSLQNLIVILSSPILLSS